ncbi:hypothetical protein CWI36_0149p0010 [Hamiltosporidium magnivora]|uniref:Uncharacterized protein n=1 Tax=Hamiltosporidium magnivora TaxID=148818 RepID=A0A4Q9LLU4_9MICR|nr:hypothetical protein CWI36_0149p0010 [Hamiltosporidium magnivora]
MEKNVHNKIFQEIEYSLQRLSISNRNLEFTELFISKLQEYDTDEVSIIITYIYNKLIKILYRILNHSDDYKNIRIFLEKKNSDLLSYDRDLTGNTIFKKTIFDAKFLENGNDEKIIQTQIMSSIINSYKFLSNNMSPPDFKKSNNYRVFFKGLETCNLFELNPNESIEYGKKGFIDFLKNFDFNYDVHLVFEDLAKIDLRDVIKEHYNTHLASKAGSSSRFTTCETRIFDIETRLISMFVMVFRDLLDHIFCDKSPKISKNIENFNDEISLEDSLKAIVLDLF